MCRVVLFAGLFFLLFAISLAIPFWFVAFPLRNQLLVLSGGPLVCYFLFLPCCLLFSLSWNFAILIMMCLSVGLFGFVLLGTLFVSWIWVTFSLIRLGKFSIITFSNRFSIPFSSSSPSRIPIIWILLCFMLSYISLNPSSFFLSLFSFSCSFWVFYSTLSSSSLI